MATAQPRRAERQVVLTADSVTGTAGRFIRTAASISHTADTASHTGNSPSHTAEPSDRTADAASRRAGHSRHTGNPASHTDKCSRHAPESVSHTGKLSSRTSKSFRGAVLGQKHPETGKNGVFSPSRRSCSVRPVAEPVEPQARRYTKTLLPPRLCASAVKTTSNS